MLRLQAQFPSTVSTVYRCVCPRVATQTWGGWAQQSGGEPPAPSDRTLYLTPQDE